MSYIEVLTIEIFSEWQGGIMKKRPSTGIEAWVGYGETGYFASTTGV